MSKVFRFVLLLTGLLLGQQRPGAAQVFEWASIARNTGTTGLNSTTSATDAAGNTYVTAGFQGQLQVGSQTLTGPAVAFIKYDADGQVLWAQSLTGRSVEHMAIDPANGGVVIAGQLPPTSSNQATPYFYAKYSAAGTQQWSNTLPALQNWLAPAAQYSYRPKLTVDGLGNCYFMGILNAAGTIGGVALDNRTTFLLQGDAAGVTQWVRQFHEGPVSSQWVGPGGLLNFGLAPKPGGGCLMWGQMHTRLYLGPGTSAPSLTGRSAYRDGALVSLDAAGTILWSQVAYAGDNIGGTLLNAGAVDAAGNCYVTGGGRGSMNFGSASTAYGFALAKYDAGGSLQWLQGQQAGTGLRTVEGTQLVVDAAGTNISVNVLDSTSLYRNVRSSVLPTRLGTLVTTAVYSVVRYNGQGQPQWIAGPRQLAAFETTGFTSFGLGLDGAGNLYWAGLPVKYRFLSPVLASPSAMVMLGAHTTVGQGVILSRLGAQANSLVGEVYQDLNSNGQRDAGEPAFTGLATAQVTQNSLDAFYPIRADGQLQAFATSGSYTLTLAPGSLPRYHTLTQPAGGSYSGSFSGSNQAQSGQVFGIGPIANQPDVRVTLTPYTPVRPGFLTRYRLTLENMGTTTATGTVAATLDGRMAYVSSAPAGTQSGNTLSWSYSNLLPQAVLNYDLQFSLPINVTLGTLLTHTASATLPGDLNPADNTATLQQTVVGSFDPNDINVDYTQLTQQQVAARQRLLYRVRFQNMGTDTAFVVTIKDTLDASRLQVSSLRMVSQSHNCLVESSSRGILTVRLINPKLPPRSTNALGSQGYILFEAVPLRTLAPGDVIPNHAHITFDFNAPLRTNTATTTVLLPTATHPGQVALSWDAYPNPATDALTIALPAGTSATAELLDALGRPVRQQPLTGTAPTLDLRTLPAGLYLLRLRTPQGYTSSRSIVRQ